MNLAWHIAKKDLRRLALPVGLWGLFVLAAGICFRVIGPSEVRGDADVTTWLTLMRDFTWLATGGLVVVGYVLVGALVQEDAPLGENGFWPTRPIGSARLLGAKTVAAIVLFIGLPVVLMTPLWLASGFSAGETARAAGTFLHSQSLITLNALLVASLARDLAGYLFRTVCLVLAYAACAYAATRGSGIATPAVHATRELVVECGWLVFAVAALVHQFITRRTARSWFLIGCGLAFGVAVRIGWPWDLTTSAQAADERPDDRTVQIDVWPSFSTFGRIDREVPFLQVTAPWTPAGFYAPVTVQANGRAEIMVLKSGWQKAGLRLLGEDAGVGPLSWQLFPFVPGEAKPDLTGELEVWHVRGRVVGELPLREGAELSVGANRTRIVGFARENDRLDAIYLQENDFARPAAERVRTQNAGPGGGGYEQFILVDRAAHLSQAVTPGGFPTVELLSQQLGFRRLFVAGEHDWSNGVLVKVVFERDHRFWRPIEVHGVTQEDSKP